MLCPTASGIGDLRFDNAAERPVARVWSQSEALKRFTGTEWMPELPEMDFGGCRCRVARITGRADAIDPACSLSPYREKLASIIESIQKIRPSSNVLQASDGNLSFRQNPAMDKTRTVANRKWWNATQPQEWHKH